MNQEWKEELILKISPSQNQLYVPGLRSVRGAHFLLPAFSVGGEDDECMKTRIDKLKENGSNEQ